VPRKAAKSDLHNEKRRDCVCLVLSGKGLIQGEKRFSLAWMQGVAETRNSHY
jgi:hypothetical protein